MTRCNCEKHVTRDEVLTHGDNRTCAPAGQVSNRGPMKIERRKIARLALITASPGLHRGSFIRPCRQHSHPYCLLDTNRSIIGLPTVTKAGGLAQHAKKYCCCACEPPAFVTVGSAIDGPVGVQQAIWMAVLKARSNKTSAVNAGDGVITARASEEGAQSSCAQSLSAPSC